MKKHIIIALIVGLSLFSTSCSKESAVQAQSIENFVKTYFPDVQVLSTIRDGFDYEVTLSDYTRIEFDSNAFGKTPEWDEINCKLSTTYSAVPAALIPAEIADYVNRLHSGKTIVKIAKDSRGWDIELNNGLEIEFNRKFNPIELDIDD